jgi:putative phosphoesterase
MRILAFVDTHGNLKALDKIKALSKKADILVCAGDISIFENNLDGLLAKLDKLNKPVLIISGNHEDAADLSALTSFSNNLIDIDKKTYTKDKFLFLGYGGGGFSMVDKEFEKKAKKFDEILKKNKDKKIILVTHAPPYKTKLDKIMGEPCGNKSIKNFILKAKPDLVISGHLHENAGKKDKIGRTRLLNPGPFGKIVIS